MTEAVEKALPISLSCSLLISVVLLPPVFQSNCRPIKKISASTEHMMKLDHGASCLFIQKMKLVPGHRMSNYLYSNLLSTIEHLERERTSVR